MPNFKVQKRRLGGQTETCHSQTRLPLKKKSKRWFWGERKGKKLVVARVLKGGKGEFTFLSFLLSVEGDEGGGGEVG